MAGPLKIVVHDVARAAGPGGIEPREMLYARFSDSVEVTDLRPGEGGLAEALAAADVLVTRKFGTGEPPAPRLRLLQVPATGHDRIEAARLPPGCALCNVHGHGPGIGEFVMASMLEWCLGLRAQEDAFRAGRWRHGPHAGAPPHGELSGRTLGILGFGQIGRAVAPRARAFGMRVAALAREPSRIGQDADAALGPDQLEDLLAVSDFLLIACPLTPETRGLLHAGRLARMKPDSVLVNVARAEVTVERDLFEALSRGRPAGAILDVWWHYPSPADPHPRPSTLPFHELPNVRLTPHVAVWSEGLLRRRWEAVAENIARLLAGEPLLNRITS